MDVKAIAMKGYSTFPKVKNYSFAIRWFSVINRTLVGESYPYKDMQSVYYTVQGDRAIFILVKMTLSSYTEYTS